MKLAKKTDLDLVEARTDVLETRVGVAEGAYFNVKAAPYNATGNNVADDTAAVAAALTAAGAAGGVVYFPAGTYRMTGTITVPSKVTLRGAGIGASTLSWATDLGIGRYAVASTGGVQHLAPQYQEIAFAGPRSTFLPTVGTRSCLMDGVQATSWTHMDEVFVSGFGANIVITGDHQKFRNTRSIYGYFNVYFGDNAAVTTTGDQEFDGCTFDFAAWANVAVHGNNTITDAHWSSTHLGFAPYGFYKFDALHPTTGVPGTAAALGGGAVASTVGLLNGCSLDKVQFEEQGNAAIQDDSTGAGQGMGTLMGTTINEPFHSWNGSDLYKIAARVKDYGVHTRISRSSQITHGTQGFGPGNIATYHIPVGGITIDGGAIQNLFSPTSNVVEGLLIRNYQYTGRVLIATAACVAGDIMEKSLNGFEVNRYVLASAGRPIMGVAAHAASAGQRVCVITEGIAYVLCEAVSYGGLYVIPGGGGVAHHGQGIVGWGMNFAHTPSFDPAFAVTLVDGGGAGGALLACLLLPPGGKDEPGFVRPQVMSALPTASAAWRGVMVRVEGGAGVADTVSICIKNAADAYVWRAF